MLRLLNVGGANVGGASGAPSALRDYALAVAIMQGDGRFFWGGVISQDGDPSPLPRHPSGEAQRAG
ncbi:hypothetical protein C2L80_03850 [Rubneribacter badeniensis]|uniref:Uncharacterized protein n=1 Tax=Rubneribacter badeniensis TaxID=2070688 RepID=A0A2K2U6G7_9ACTN|nr:hypothetical protein C2L80_03850 [Rubneribacter badeniensis]